MNDLADRFSVPDLDEAGQMVLRLVREFAEREVAPRAAAIDETGDFPADLVQRMGELGLMGIPIPEEYGGAGLSYGVFAQAVETLCRACATTGLIMDVNTSLCSEPILLFGSEEQKQRLLTPLARGERLGALAMTEAEAGSDAAGIQTSAMRDGDVYRLNGRKVFCTNGGRAGTYVVTAVTDAHAGHRGISDFVVEREFPGVSFGNPLRKMGISGSATCDVILQNVPVPATNRLGEEGMGFRITMETLDAGRIGIAAQATGIAQAALDDALTYAGQRRQFGQPIAEFQAIQMMIADMAVQVEAARLLYLRAAALRDKGLPCAKESAMAKFFAGDAAMRVTTDAVQVFGGYGYIKDFPVERHMRDAKITQIYEGTNQIQRVVVARSLFKERT